MPFRLREGISTAEVEYGTALLDERHSQYWNLNPTGALVLRVLLDGGRPEQAADALAEEYGIDADSARSDVDDLVDELRSAGLLEQEVAPEPGGRR